ncbi:MAG TPA: hypothetical protein VFX12_01635 [Vicinamibacterales bacterium]|nr:hypothetical protein [Vicinamibacterales bacterium]
MTDIPRITDKSLDEALDATIRTMVDGEPSPGFRARVVARLGEPGRRGPGVEWITLSALAAAIVVAIVLWLPRRGVHLPTPAPRAHADVALARPPAVDGERRAAPAAIRIARPSIDGIRPPRRPVVPTADAPPLPERPSVAAVLVVRLAEPAAIEVPPIGADPIEVARLTVRSLPAPPAVEVGAFNPRETRE